jgi:hypothetical protein
MEISASALKLKWPRSRFIKRRQQHKADQYLDVLEQEIIHRAPLFAGRQVSQLHLKDIKILVSLMLLAGDNLITAAKIAELMAERDMDAAFCRPPG